MTASKIAIALGGTCRSGRWWRCRCPVHGSHSATLALRDGEQGLLVKCFAGCDARDVFAELRWRGLLGDAPHDRCHRPARAIIPPHNRADAVHRIALARRIWNVARDARGSPVVRYLAGRRITIPLPPSLRSAPACPHPSGIYLPAMLARVVNIDGELIGVHRTYLDREATGQWHRRDRASLGPIGGGAVRLTPPAETLMVAEGIETALAVMQATAQPVWAALSTSGMTALRLPTIVRIVVILTDNDINGAGERAARTAAQHWLAEGRRVRLALPPEPGTDFADVLAGRSYTRMAEVCRDAA